MGKRTNPMKQTDVVDTEEPFDTRHEARAGIYELSLDEEDTASLNDAEELTPTLTNDMVDENANEVTSETDSTGVWNDRSPSDDWKPADEPDTAMTTVHDPMTLQPENTAMEPTTADLTPIENTEWAMPSKDLADVKTNEDADLVLAPEETAPADEAEESADVQAARARIEQTRAEMSETIDAIKEKLNPQHLVQEAKDTARMKAEEMAHTAVETTKEVIAQAKDKVREAAPRVVGTVKRNPVPFLLGGLFFGWLLIRARSRSNRKIYCD